MYFTLLPLAISVLILLRLTAAASARDAATKKRIFQTWLHWYSQTKKQKKHHKYS